MSNFVATFRRVTAAVVALAALSVLPQPTPAQSDIKGSEEIQQGLAKIQVLGSALMIAAHPDDENTAVLAWLSEGRHIRTGYLSLTRGEGGQNLVGSEQGDALGVLRTQELLDARRIDGAEQFFTRAIDFGFSKSPTEAIAKWGHDEILSDIVWVIRQFEPDVIILRFSGTPQDGHGHHQASAILGQEAFTAAADPARFPEQLQWVKPWRAKRLVWNVFSFTPDQEKAAAKITGKISVDVGAFNPVLGRSYGEIAGISRSQHRSQGMGVPEQRGPSVNYFSPKGGDSATSDLFDGVDTSWTRIAGGAGVGKVLSQAAREFNPHHPELLVPMLAGAQKQITALLAANPKNLWAREKQKEVNQLLLLCSGVWVDAVADRYAFSPGDAMKVTVTALKRLPIAVRWKTVAFADSPESAADSSGGMKLGDDQPEKKELTRQIADTEPYSQPFWLAEPRQGDRYTIPDQQLIGRAAPLPVFRVALRFEIAGALVSLEEPVHYRYVDHVRGELVRPVEIVPPVAVDLPERAVIFPNGEERRIMVQIRDTQGAVAGQLKLDIPTGWTATPTGDTDFQMKSSGDQQDFTYLVKPPEGSAGASARFRAIALVKGHEISTGMQPIEYEHIPPQVVFRPAEGALEPASLTVLAKNIGYIMGAGDAVPDAIRQMGCTVRLLSPEDLMRGNLSQYDAIVTGVRAYNVRPDLHASESRLIDYVRNGGTLVVQYNVLEFTRFGGDPIQPGPLGPYSIELSRDRVTDEESPIKLTDPRSPLLNVPNTIGLADFSGWVQERGLYFAGKWDPHYQTILETHDPGEKDLPGGMLCSRYGKGAYIFTAYSWFRELPAGVPGAYRIFANLLSAGKAWNEATSPTR